MYKNYGSEAQNKHLHLLKFIRKKSSLFMSLQTTPVSVIKKKNCQDYSPIPLLAMTRWKQVLQANHPVRLEHN